MPRDHDLRKFEKPRLKQSQNDKQIGFEKTFIEYFHQPFWKNMQLDKLPRGSFYASISILAILIGIIADFALPDEDVADSKTLHELQSADGVLQLDWILMKGQRNATFLGGLEALNHDVPASLFVNRINLAALSGQQAEEQRLRGFTVPYTHASDDGFV